MGIYVNDAQIHGLHRFPIRQTQALEVIVHELLQARQKATSRFRGANANTLLGFKRNQRYATVGQEDAMAFELSHPERPDVLDQCNVSLNADRSNSKAHLSEVAPFEVASQTAALSPKQSSENVLTESKARATPWKLGVFRGWTSGTFFGACAASSVRVLNIALTAGATAKFGVHDGIGTITEGGCNRTATLGFWIPFGH